MSNNVVLVTGGAGYVGSHAVISLISNGFDVVIFDSLELGHIEIVNSLKSISGLSGKVVDFVRGDLLNLSEIESVIKTYKPCAVMHFAAYSQVAESMANPQKYYINNVGGTLNLLKAMMNNNVMKIVFSSTAATYGEPVYVPIDEKHPQQPINTYGKTKLMIENIMDDYDSAYGLKSVRLRYFNVAGADSNARVGEWHEPETHLIPNVLKSVFEKGNTFKMFGTDYETKDGTCVRDYINVEDLAQAHVLALNYLLNGGETNYFNLGTTSGSSVKEVFSTCEKITGQNIPVQVLGRRAGDPAVLIADNSKAGEVLGWKPVKSLDDSVNSAYNWEKILQSNKVALSER